MALVLFACGSDDGPSEADSQLVLYKVNYDNLEFDGGRGIVSDNGIFLFGGRNR